MCPIMLLLVCYTLRVLHLLKGQDVVVLLKLIALRGGAKPTQAELAINLCMSASEVNAALKRLRKADLLSLDVTSDALKPNIKTCEEFLLHGVQYVFPVEAGQLVRGIPTAYAAPILNKELNFDESVIPVWPHIEGSAKGYLLKPLYSSVPKSFVKYPDTKLYDLLALVDAIRGGRAREKNIAKKKLVKILNE